MGFCVHFFISCSLVFFSEICRNTGVAGIIFNCAFPKDNTFLSFFRFAVLPASLLNYASTRLLRSAFRYASYVISSRLHSCDAIPATLLNRSEMCYPNLSIYLSQLLIHFIFLSIFVSISLSIYVSLPIHLSICDYLSITLSVFLPTYLLIYKSICKM